jgi:hypothetical protein
MPKVDLLNLIPSSASRKKAPETIRFKGAREAAELIRKSCAVIKADNYAEWCQVVRRNCPLPHDHPYRHLLENRGVRSDDPLWILGSIAFGCQPSSLVFHAIHWPDGTKDHPDQMNRDWIKR